MRDVASSDSDGLPGSSVFCRIERSWVVHAVRGIAWIGMPAPKIISKRLGSIVIPYTTCTSIRNMDLVFSAMFCAGICDAVRE